MSHDRFFIDHGAIHDRMTGKHVGMQAEVEWQPRLLSLLNYMWEQITALERSGRIVAAPSPSLGEPKPAPETARAPKTASVPVSELKELAEQLRSNTCYQSQGDYRAADALDKLIYAHVDIENLPEEALQFFNLPVASPTAAQGQKPVAIPMSVHEAAQACVDNFLPTTAHPTFKDGLLRKIEQYFAPLFASPAPADGFVKMDNPDYAEYLRKDWVMVPREPTEAMLAAGIFLRSGNRQRPGDVYKAMLAAAKVTE